jgi:phosphate/sulfate permease
MKAEKQNQTLHINLSNPRAALVFIVIFLSAFVASLIGLAVFLTFRLVEIEAQNRTILLVVCLPIVGLALATFLILQKSEKILKNKHEEFWQLMLPEEQKRKLNAEARELGKILGMKEEELSYVRAACVLAEDLALRQIEQEKKVPLKRHVKLGEVEFTALFLEKNYSIFVEVMLVVTPTIDQEKINALLSKADSARKNLQKIKTERKEKLLLMIVTQLNQQDEMKLRSSLAEKFSATTVDVDIRFFDFEALQRIYTED